MFRVATALLITSSQERRPSLAATLKSLNLEVLVVRNCRQARQLLETCRQIEVVITDASLPDGNWCDVLKYLVDGGMGASVVVSSSTADERLWSEAIWRGAYDLLVDPLDNSEVHRIVQGAVEAAHRKRAPGKALVAALTGGLQAVGP